MSFIDLPNTWENTNIAEILVFAIGGDWGKVADDPIPEGYEVARVIRGTEFKNWDKEKGTSGASRAIKRSSIGKRKLKEGDIVLEISGGGPTQPVGRSVLIDSSALSISPYPVVSSNFFRLVRLSEFSDSRFIQKYLSFAHELGFLNKFQKNTTNIRNLNFTEFIEELNIPLPPLNEQRRIVAKIEELSDRTRKAREALEDVPKLIEQFRRSVLAAAFRGDLTAEWREQNPDVEPVDELIERGIRNHKPGKSTGRAASINIIPGRAALSVGDSKAFLPKGWKRVALLKIARLESGHTPSKRHPEYWGGDIPWITIKDARDSHGHRVFSTYQHTNELGLANSAARLLPKNTVCLSRTASVGYAVIMGEDMATSQDFVNWICSDALLPEFLLYAFLAEGEHLLKFGKGTNHTTIYFPEVKSLHITLPPLEEQKGIIKEVRDNLSRIDSFSTILSQDIGNLNLLDRAILAKAFRGELVPQDPTDEPASQLLDRIRAEREKLTPKKATKKRKPRKSKPPQQISLDL